MKTQPDQIRRPSAEKTLAHSSAAAMYERIKSTQTRMGRSIRESDLRSCILATFACMIAATSMLGKEPTSAEIENALTKAIRLTESTASGPGQPVPIAATESVDSSDATADLADLFPALDADAHAETIKQTKPIAFQDIKNSLVTETTESEGADLSLPENWGKPQTIQLTQYKETKPVELWKPTSKWIASPNWPPRRSNEVTDKSAETTDQRPKQTSKPITSSQKAPEHPNAPEPNSRVQVALQAPVATPIPKDSLSKSRKGSTSIEETETLPPPSHVGSPSRIAPIPNAPSPELVPQNANTAMAVGVINGRPSIKVTDHDAGRFYQSLMQSMNAEPHPQAIPNMLGVKPMSINPHAIQNAPQSKIERALNAFADAPAERRPGRFPYTHYQRDRFERSVIDSLQRMSSSGPANHTQPPTRNGVPQGYGRTVGHPMASTHSGELPAPVKSSEPAKKPAAKKEAPFDQLSGRRPNYHHNDFSPNPVDQSSTYFDSNREAWVYDSKYDVPTQHPLIEYPRVWYGNGITPKGIDVFGYKNLLRPKFYMYGDYRTGVQAGRNAAGRADNWAHRLNLDLDFQFTDSERFHMFMGPLDSGGQFTRLELVNGEFDFEEEIDFTPATGFFEMDLGVMMGTINNRTSPFELPFTIGLVPLLFQNGIWMEDAVTGAAFAIPARHSRLLNISNMDLTFFAVVDQLNSAAFDDEHSAQAFGTAWFLEAYKGYIEAGYAYLNDRNNDDRDYHNITFSYTRRYFDRISNSVRVIVNAGQDGPDASRTADGGILLFENSWVSAKPLTVVPYANFFYGWDRPQSVARAGGSGGLLRNTGLNFQSDGLNGFAFLDDTGIDTAGGAVGVDLIGDQLDKQLIVEGAFQTSHGSKNPNVPDDQFAIGARYQVNLNNWSMLRFDTMYGWRSGLEDIYGTRMEYRWKF